MSSCSSEGADRDAFDDSHGSDTYPGRKSPVQEEDSLSEEFKDIISYVDWRPQRYNVLRRTCLVWGADSSPGWSARTERRMPQYQNWRKALLRQQLDFVRHGKSKSRNSSPTKKPTSGSRKSSIEIKRTEVATAEVPNKDGAEERVSNGDEPIAAEIEITVKSGDDGLPKYQFSGIHTLFDEGRNSEISCISFANALVDTLCYGTSSGILCIAKMEIEQSSGSAPMVVARIPAHAGRITAIDFSSTNEYLLTSGVDSTVRVWSPPLSDDGIPDYTTGRLACIRLIDVYGPALDGRFHPVNQNVFVVGVKSPRGGLVEVHSVSAGTVLQRFQLPHYAGKDNKRHHSVPTCLTFDSFGRMLFVGDDHGQLYYFCFHDLEAPASHKYLDLDGVQSLLRDEGAIASIAYSNWMRSGPDATPSLLVGSIHPMHAISLFRVLDATNRSEDQAFVLFRKFPCTARRRVCKAKFCPLVVMEGRGACFAMGTEDGMVEILSVTSPATRPVVNELPGHDGAVTDVAWSYDERLLASGDENGTVIVWKRNMD